jgi:hypothetical protein
MKKSTKKFVVVSTMSVEMKVSVRCEDRTPPAIVSRTASVEFPDGHGVGQFIEVRIGQARRAPSDGDGGDRLTARDDRELVEGNNIPPIFSPRASSAVPSSIR